MGCNCNHMIYFTVEEPSHDEKMEIFNRFTRMASVIYLEWVNNPDYLIECEDFKHPELYQIGHYSKIMSKCDIAYFGKGWERSFLLASLYNLALWHGLSVETEETICCEYGGDQNGKSKPYYVEHRILADGKSQSVQLRNDAE